MANPQIAAIRQMLTENPIITPEAKLEDMRKGLDAMGLATPPLENISSSKVNAGGVDATWLIANDADNAPVVLFLHGGGYVMGSVTSHRPMIERLAVAADGRVLALDYRLAPENPFPAAVDDALNAYRWLLDEGIRPGQIAVAGDSAGGGLAVAALVAIKQAGLDLPACATPISPWVDMEGLGESMNTKAAEDPMVQKEGLLMIAPLYLNGADPRTPLAAPLYADLAGLPPMLIQVGSAETLLDDAKRLAERIETSGGSVTLEVWDEMIHVWHLFAPMLDKGQEGIDRVGGFIREHTG